MTAREDETAATSMMARDRTRAGPMQPLPRRSQPPERRPPARAPARRRTSRVGPFVVFLGLVLAGLVAILIANELSGGGSTLPEVDASDPQEAIQQLRDLIDSNTR